MTDPDPRTRAITLGRDRHRCVRCETYLRPGQWPGMSIHHRLARSRGTGCPQLHQPSNLISLCGTGTTGCHGWIHAHPERSRQLGWIIGDTDPRDPDRIPVHTSRDGWLLLDTDGNAAPCPPPDGMPARIPRPQGDPT